MIDDSSETATVSKACLDLWHQELHRETCSMHKELEGATLSQRLVRVLALLNVHVFEHLEVEEKMLRRRAGPSLPAHLEQHRRLRMDVGGLTRRFSLEGTSRALAELTFRTVLEWLDGHVPSMDLVLAHEPAKRGSPRGRRAFGG